MVRDTNLIEVFVDTLLDIWEQYEVKDMYAKARRGEIVSFTGIDAPYEPSERVEIVMNKVSHKPEKNARLILEIVTDKSFVKSGKLLTVGSRSVLCLKVDPQSLS